MPGNISFNDHYGYWHGDQMIRMMVKCAVASGDALVADVDSRAIDRLIADPAHTIQRISSTA